MNQHPVTLQDKVRSRTSGLLTVIGRGVGRFVHPNVITLAGLVPVLLASIYISRGDFQLAGVILLIGLPLDALDGAVARATGKTSRFGAILDATTDRYADGMLFGAMAVYFATQQLPIHQVLCLVALVASFGTSYIRAKAGEVGIEVRVGLLDRMVRSALLLVGLLVPQLLVSVVTITAVLGMITNVQRLAYASSHDS